MLVPTELLQDLVQLIDAEAFGTDDGEQLLCLDALAKPLVLQGHLCVAARDDGILYLAQDRRALLHRRQEILPRNCFAVRPIEGLLHALHLVILDAGRPTPFGGCIERQDAFVEGYVRKRKGRESKTASSSRRAISPPSLTPYCFYC